VQFERDFLSHPRSSRLRTPLSNLIRDESGVTALAAFTLVGTNFSTIAAKL
jgi:hypothetical protein